MKIELKRIHHSERMSEETAAFTANLYIDGKMAGIVSNSGTGGPTRVQSTSPEGRLLIQKAEKWCQALPPELYAEGGKMPIEIRMDLEGYIDKLLHHYLSEKDIKQYQQKVRKAMKEHIVISADPKSACRLMRLNMPIEALLTLPAGVSHLRKFIAEKALPKLSENEKIINSNIPEQILKEAGLQESQYNKPTQQDSQKQTAAKKKGKKI